MSQQVYYSVYLEGPEREQVACLILDWLQDEEGETDAVRIDTGVTCICPKNGLREMGDTFHWRLTEFVQQVMEGHRVTGEVSFEGEVAYTVYCGQGAAERTSRQHLRDILTHLHHLVPADRRELRAALVRLEEHGAL